MRFEIKLVTITSFSLHYLESNNYYNLLLLHNIILHSMLTKCLKYLSNISITYFLISRTSGIKENYILSYETKLHFFGVLL